MAINKFRTFRIDDNLTSRFQDNVSDFTSQLENKPQLDSVILKDIAVVSGSDNFISHKLGRPFQGWQIIDKDAASDFWQPSGATNKDLFLTLQSTANCTISILVF